MPRLLTSVPPIAASVALLYNIAEQKYTYLDEPNADALNGIEQTAITGISNSGEICGYYVDTTSPTGTQYGFTAVGVVAD